MTSAEPRLEQPIRSIEAITPYRSKIVISTREGYYLIDKAAIRFIEADGNYCFIHFGKSEKVLCSKPLKHLESKLGSGSFFKTHQSYLVNANSICFVDPTLSKIELEGGQSLPVSRSKKETLRFYLKNMFD